jgi:hypothetical protein
MIVVNAKLTFRIGAWIEAATNRTPTSLLP